MSIEAERDLGTEHELSPTERDIVGQFFSQGDFTLQEKSRDWLKWWKVNALDSQIVDPLLAMQFLIHGLGGAFNMIVRLSDEVARLRKGK